MNIYTKILSIILTEQKENVICSPITIYQIMLLLAEITNGNTQKEIFSVLKLSNLAEVRAVSNSIYKENVRFREEHPNDIDQKFFTAYPRQIPYEQWISNQMLTGGGINIRQAAMKSLAHIYHLHTETSQDTSDVPFMRILSSFVFKAQWRDRFYPEDTKQETFHGERSDTTVEMMHRTYNTVYYSGAGFSMISFSIDRAGSMMIILPNPDADLDSISPDAAIINNSDKETFALKSEYVRVHASIPKFSINSDLSLITAFKSMGISMVFDPYTADFSAITSDNAVINNVQHSTKLEIDESGISGISYVSVELLGAPPPPKKEVDFIVNRPFLFYITGRHDGILFAGKIYDI